jgi:lipopolysaccharide/colanic/teichoic acid biosynthesis glycosyltransferase
MTTKNLGRPTTLIVASTAGDFADIVCLSDAAFLRNLSVIPIQSQHEVSDAIAHGAECLFVIHPDYAFTEEQIRLIKRGVALGAHLSSLKTYKNHVNGSAEIENIGDLLEWLGPSTHKPQSFIFEKLKCMTRRIIALFLLAFSLPLFLAIGLAIKFSDDGPVFYSQRRVGFRGKKFNLLKFRTMKINAEADGPRWSGGDADPRTFAFGKFLRKSHLDELPQLWNIIKGDLCFIGPRPERPEFHQLLENKIPYFDTRTRVKPGITGWAQIFSGYASTVEECKIKIAHDLYFMRNSHAAVQAKIVFKTIQKIIREIIFAVCRKIAGIKSKAD